MITALRERPAWGEEEEEEEDSLFFIFYFLFSICHSLFNEDSLFNKK